MYTIYFFILSVYKHIYLHIFLAFLCTSHQIQHYTNQLAMDTKTKLMELSNIQAPPGTSDAVSMS